MKRLKSHKLDHFIEGIGRIKVYDMPSAIDRYTIVYLDTVEDILGRPRSIQAIGTAANPRYHSGSIEISQVGPHLGKIIHFDSLPDACKRMVESDAHPIYEMGD